MKVLLINDFVEGGGAEGVYRSTVDILKEHGHTVKSFYGAKRACTPKNFFNYLYNRKYKKALDEVLLNFKPDTIHIHNYYHLLSASIFVALRNFKKKNPNSKVILTAHDFHLICPSSHLMYFNNGYVKNISIPVRVKEWYNKSIDRRGIKYSIVKKNVWLFERVVVKPMKVIDVIVSPSQFLISTFKKSGIKNHMVCIRNPQKANNVVRQIIKQGVKEIKAVFFGRLSAEKGLFEFFNLAMANDIQLEVDIYGDGNEKEKLKYLLKDKTKIKVNFFGRINNEHLQKKLPNYHVALIPSIGYENAPLTIPEAANAGLLIWGTDNGGIKEMCEEVNIPHFLFKPNTLHSFKQSYNNLCTYLETKQVLTIELGKFSEDTFYRETLTVYKCK
ncbi:glycosyltransferase [Saccharicrinis sp. GN24d3]|uniref:glycosyltransferase n=1 Tax=Saccharicrinis sp. GN24d3 TaxID=3458416 RepID=UPI004036CCC1